jgi:hypothetical protein
MAADRWISAREAVALVNRLSVGSRNDGAAKLTRLAADEGVRSRCRIWSSKDEFGQRVLAPEGPLSSEFWDEMLEGAVIADWDNGEFQARIYRSVQGNTETRVHGVEFCETDIIAHYGKGVPAPTPPPTFPPSFGRVRPGEMRLSDLKLEQRARLPPAADPVTPDEADAWYASLAPKEQAMGLRWLHARAKADHPGRQVVRKLIEKFVEGRKTGRPAGR